MIPLKQALESNFRDSTDDELAAYVAELGETFPPRANQATKRARLLELCNKTTGFKPVTVETRSKRAPSEVVPPYNLILERGKWGGRRHKVRLHRPPDTPASDAGKTFTSQGYAFTLRYEHVEVVPEPILNAIREPSKGRGVIESTLDDEGYRNTHTRIVMDPAYRHDYLGVDEATKNRAGSLHEFYAKKGGEDFLLAMTPEQINEVCAYIGDMTVKDKMDRPYDAETLRTKLINFFFPRSADSHNDDHDDDEAAAA